MKISYLFFLILSVMLIQCMPQKEKPTIYIIGDSTVKNGHGDGAGGLWGWGDFIGQYFDTTLVSVENDALGGTSSRTYRTLGIWDPVLEKISKGDYVLMQFGHNDAGNINDNSRARGTIKGIGEETEEIDNILTKKHEIVHSYGWYMRQYIREVKEKGGIPVIMSPIPRNDWVNGKVPRNNVDSYGMWAKQVADEAGVLFIDLNQKMAEAMENLGENKVTNIYFYKRDHTHTSAKGAVLSASLIVDGMKNSSDKKLKSYLLENPVITLPAKKNLFIIGDSTVSPGNEQIEGWGDELSAFMDTMRLNIYNKARGGRSSRTYIYEGLWDEIMKNIQKGDFVLIQFGHNDGGNIDTPKYRGSLKGMGDETQIVTYPDGKKETVHTYGWYMKKYVSDAKSKGAEIIVLSMIPRNRWTNGKVDRASNDYGKWARLAAEAEDGIFLDLNETVAQKYEKMGPKKVASLFKDDKTHTYTEGAQLNALTVAELIKNCKESKLRDYVLF